MLSHLSKYLRKLEHDKKMKHKDTLLGIQWERGGACEWTQMYLMPSEKIKIQVPRSMKSEDTREAMYTTRYIVKLAWALP